MPTPPHGTARGIVTGSAPIPPQQPPPSQPPPQGYLPYSGRQRPGWWSKNAVSLLGVTVTALIGVVGWVQLAQERSEAARKEQIRAAVGNLETSTDAKFHLVHDVLDDVRDSQQASSEMAEEQFKYLRKRLSNDRDQTMDEPPSLVKARKAVRSAGSKRRKRALRKLPKPRE